MEAYHLTARETLKKFPTRIVEKAILGVLPHTKLGRSMEKIIRI